MPTEDKNLVSKETTTKTKKVMLQRAITPAKTKNEGHEKTNAINALHAHTHRPSYTTHPSITHPSIKTNVESAAKDFINAKTINSLAKCRS